MAVPSARLMSRQRGVALITALLVVALATVAAVAMASRQQLDVRRTANLLDGDQAYAYALAVEGWGGMILARDLEDNEVDKLDDAWAQRLPPIPVPGGQIDGFILDLHARFNLNNLLAADGQPSAPDLAYFQRLLRALGLSEGLATAVLDWIDGDFDMRFPDGAEDDYYLSTERPYRAANRPLQSISELRLVRGVDTEIWNTLAPHVSALPTRTALNINTAAAPLLQALVEELTAQDTEQLVEARGEAGYASVPLFLEQELFAGREIDTAGLAVTSQYFLIRSEITVGTARARLFSVVERQANGIRTLARTQGTW
ncbi:type II secretion system minor pseudopilin GspK [Oceanibaculum nanhaiense]|uniref:type II secretion system minor pseudopilin GspK n=1 Tax=Oceanibaculum nanhaiense TaxID=1909734 RepID=UPI00396DDB1B